MAGTEVGKEKEAIGYETAEREMNGEQGNVGIDSVS